MKCLRHLSSVIFLGPRKLIKNSFIFSFHFVPSYIKLLRWIMFLDFCWINSCGKLQMVFSICIRVISKILSWLLLCFYFAQGRTSLRLTAQVTIQHRKKLTWMMSVVFLKYRYCEAKVVVFEIRNQYSGSWAENFSCKYTRNVRDHWIFLTFYYAFWCVEILRLFHDGWNKISSSLYDYRFILTPTCIFYDDGCHPIRISRILLRVSWWAPVATQLDLTSVVQAKKF